MTTLAHTAETEDEGLLHVYRHVHRMGYVWRDFLRHDVGIDLVIEIVFDKKATGLLVAVQVKSGNSYFQRKKEGKIKIAISPDHVGYWYEFSLPVVLVAYSPASKRACWKALDVYDLLNAERGRGVFVEIDTSHVFDHTSSTELEALAKEHRNKARGFTLTYRSQRDQENRDRWSRLTIVLQALLERSKLDYAPSLSPKMHPVDLVERQYNVNDALLHEAEFLAELIRWDLSSAQRDPNQKAPFRADALSELQRTLVNCREAWQGSYLEEWLLKELGGLVGDWHKDVLDCLWSARSEVRSRWNFRCPVCYSSETHQPEDEEDLSYSLGGIDYSLYRVHTLCVRCGTRYVYEWGGSGPSLTIRSHFTKPKEDTLKPDDVPF